MKNILIGLVITSLFAGVPANADGPGGFQVIDASTLLECMRLMHTFSDHPSQGYRQFWGIGARKVCWQELPQN